MTPSPASYPNKHTLDASASHATSIASSLSHKEPSRSFYYSSFRGSPAPIDSEQNARDVREDTAELASFALSERASSIHSTSPGGPSTLISRIESFFLNIEDASSRPSNRLNHHEPIEELSEPVSPNSNGGGTSAGDGKAPVGNIAVGIEALRRASESSSSSSSSNHPKSPPTSEGMSMEGKKQQPKSHVVQVSSQHGTDATVNQNDINEATPLLVKLCRQRARGPSKCALDEPDLESQADRSRSWPKVRDTLSHSSRKASEMLRIVASPKSWSKKAILDRGVRPFIANQPAVFLAVVLNILDALSYGLILFPLGSPIFSGLGSAGISMFYVSCIVSQLVFSLGGSAFKGGLGSEMIEVVPFFHSMAYSIMDDIGEEHPRAVLATTIVAYALSSILTGFVFGLMGLFRFGYVVGFIPRHILTGCIGGVGVFLIITGAQVSARIEGDLNYNLPTLFKMLQSDTLSLWLIPLCLALFVCWSQHQIPPKYSKHYLPAFIIAIAAVFWIVVLSLDGLDQHSLQKAGWIFNGPDSGEKWYYFYSLYDFNLVRWASVVKTIPAMAALTFFGILHVPINIPALGVAVGDDNLNVDRELLAHGLSNGLSGLCGSIQNYLVYTNSVIFIRAGGNSRLAGVMVAFATAVVMVIGPVIISYIPVMMVGTLIFFLGFDLVFESVTESWKKLRWLEFLTVMIIIVTMGFYDFVLGIFLGFALAFFSLVVQSSRVKAIRSQFSGQVAKSTVRRSPLQMRYLHEVGAQTEIVKLSGFLFFGTIVSVEDSLKQLISDEEFKRRPLRFLIVDFTHVTGIDFSAAEAFLRINRLVGAKKVNLVLAGVKSSNSLGMALRKSGLGEEGGPAAFFDNLNLALESCENEYLKAFYQSKPTSTRDRPSAHLNVPSPATGSHRFPSSPTFDPQLCTPRRQYLHQVAKDLSGHEDAPAGSSKYLPFGEPLRLILQTFHGLTNKNEDFWWQAVPYFVRREHAEGTVLFSRGEPAEGFYLLEDGILHLDYDTPQGRLHESIVAGTTCGELPFFSETDRTATCQAERHCVTWLLDRARWEELQKKEPAVANELLAVGLKLTKERMDAITSHMMTVGR